MSRMRLLMSVAALVATITLGLSWNTGMVQAMESAECNCIDGHTNRDGVYGWDSEQQRFKCVTGGCYVITQ